MKVQEMLSNATDAMNVKRVFGEPYEKDGVTIIPVAKFGGGGGGGGGDGPDGSGSGGGFGLGATPAGVYVIKDGKVAWQPAVDVNRIVLGCQIVGTLALLLLRARIKARRSRSNGA